MGCGAYSGRWRQGFEPFFYTPTTGPVLVPVETPGPKLASNPAPAMITAFGPLTQSVPSATSDSWIRIVARPITTRSIRLRMSICEAAAFEDTLQRASVTSASTSAAGQDDVVHAGPGRQMVFGKETAADDADPERRRDQAILLAAISGFRRILAVRPALRGR